MGKKLAALLRKPFRTSKFKTLTNSAISRIAYLEKQHKIRCSQTRADVVQLLSIGQQERALLRVEHVIREQNMLDAYAMIENYCHLLMERVAILENNKKCPDELKEAISSLIFAASRCGELLEMQKIRSLFESRFGKEFVTRAVELRNNCGVNPKIAKKLATRRRSLDSKLKTLNEIAPVNDISLKLERKTSTLTEQKKGKEPKYVPEQYRDVEAATQAAFNFAAGASVELSKPCENPDSQNSSMQGKYNAFKFDEAMISELHIGGDAALKENKNYKHWNACLDSDKANGILRSKARSERIADNKHTGFEDEDERLRNKKPDEATDRDLPDEIRFQVLKENLPTQADTTEGISRLEWKYHKLAEQMISRNSKVGRRPRSMKTRRAK